MAQDTNNILNTLLGLVAGPARGAGVLSAYDPTNPNMGNVFNQETQQGFEQPLSPYQSGVEKALKKAGEAHATEAVASGVPPEHIEQQAGFRGKGASGSWGPPIDPTQVPQNQSIAPSSQISSQQSAFQAPASNQSQNIFQLLGNLLGIKGGNVQNGTYQPAESLGLFRESAKDSLMRQQAASLTPENQTLAKVMEAKQVPPTQYEQQSLKATGFAAQSQNIKDRVSALDASEKNLQEQLKTYESIRGPMNKAFGGPSKEMKVIQNSIAAIQKVKGSAQKELADLYGKQPNFNPSSSGQSGQMGLPSQEDAPKGAKGYDTAKKTWVY